MVLLSPKRGTLEYRDRLGCPKRSAWTLVPVAVFITIGVHNAIMATDVKSKSAALKIIISQWVSLVDETI